MQGDVLDDSVALVEDSENRDPLRHRRHSALTRCSRWRLLRRSSRVLLLGAFAARGERDDGQQGCNGCPHAYSGIQGS
jgi:hypothetical protein